MTLFQSSSTVVYFSDYTIVFYKWLDGDNSVVEDDIDFITCARDTFVAEEDVDLAASKLLDLLSNKPIEVSHSKTTPSDQSSVILTKPVDWSFAFP